VTVGDCGEQLNLFDPLNLDSESAHVLGIIRRHEGRGNAIAVDQITEQTGIAPRQVRDIVKGLIERHRVRIGSALRPPAGYYIIKTAEEAEENEKTLRRLGISILARAAVLKGIGIEEYLKRIQVKIEF
jgi:DNA-binding MarR family transcriptional regulator